MGYLHEIMTFVSKASYVQESITTSQTAPIKVLWVCFIYQGKVWM